MLRLSEDDRLIKGGTMNRRIFPSRWVWRLCPILVFSLVLTGFVVAGGGSAGDRPANLLPASVEDLPPGSLRDQLNALPPGAAERALRNLRELKIPVQDYPLLLVDPEGNLFYEERELLPDGPPKDL